MRLCWSNIPHCWKSHALAAAQLSFYVHFKFLSLDTLKIGFILFADTDMNVLKIEIKLNLLRVLFIDKTLAAIFKTY